MPTPGDPAPRFDEPSRPALPDHIRAGDGDRQRVVAELQDHFVAGRLTTDELSERVQQTLAARTFGDLALVLHDLPPLQTMPAPVSPTDDRLTRREQRRADRLERRRYRHGGRRSLRSHAGSYFLVMGLLVAIWLLTSPGHYFWPIWPMLGWGIGLASHTLAALNHHHHDELSAGQQTSGATLL